MKLLLTCPNFLIYFFRSVEDFTETEMESREKLEAAVRIARPAAVITDAAHDRLRNAWLAVSILMKNPQHVRVKYIN